MGNPEILAHHQETLDNHRTSVRRAAADNRRISARRAAADNLRISDLPPVTLDNHLILAALHREASDRAKDPRVGAVASDQAMISPEVNLK